MMRITLHTAPIALTLGGVALGMGALLACGGSAATLSTRQSADMTGSYDGSVAGDVGATNDATSVSATKRSLDLLQSTTASPKLGSSSTGLDARSKRTGARLNTGTIVASRRGATGAADAATAVAGNGGAIGGDAAGTVGSRTIGGAAVATAAANGGGAALGQSASGTAGSINGTVASDERAGVARTTGKLARAARFTSRTASATAGLADHSVRKTLAVGRTFHGAAGAVGDAAGSVDGATASGQATASVAVKPVSITPPAATVTLPAVDMTPGPIALTSTPVTYTPMPINLPSQTMSFGGRPAFLTPAATLGLSGGLRLR